MLRFILKNRHLDLGCTLETGSMHTLDVACPELQAALNSGGMGQGCYSITELVGVEVIPDPVAAKPPVAELEDATLHLLRQMNSVWPEFICLIPNGDGGGDRWDVIDADKMESGSEYETSVIAFGRTPRITILKAWDKLNMGELPGGRSE